MLPLHYTKLSVFNYEEIPAGYYYQKMIHGGATQRFWHQKKFQEVAGRIRDGSNVLDFGCGPGSFLSILGREKPHCRAVGVDIAPMQIDFARKEISSKYEDSRVRFQDLKLGEERLPFDDHSFDYVTSIEVFEHIHPYIAMKILKELRRVLKPDGRIIITTPNYRSHWPLIEWGLERLSEVKYHDQHINKFTPNALLKFLETAGLEVVSLNSIFVLAPFLAGFSWKFAEGLHRFELSSDFTLGSLLIAEAKPLSLNVLGE